MVNEEHYARLKESVHGWNEWRIKNSSITPDLSGANLRWVNLSGANLRRANLSGANLREANLSEANLSEANLSGANLRKANISGANLKKANLRGANLRWANLNGANLIGLDLSGLDLRWANLSGANLIGLDLSKANLSGLDLSGLDLRGANLRETNLRETNLSEANLSGLDLSGLDLSGLDLRGANLRWANLSGANLSEANLSEANLSEANLRRANLSRANLNEAKLIRTQVLGTDFTGGKFTSVNLEDWHINSTTKLNDIDCQYVYLKSDKQERRPSSGEFAPGEFTKLFQKALETVDLIFCDGIDWKAFIFSLQELQAEYSEENLSVQAFEKKSGGAFVVRLEVLPEANKAEIECRIKELYEVKLNQLEVMYRKELQAKDEQIISYKEQSASIMNLAIQMASRPIQNIINITANAENKPVSETFNNNFNQPNIANLANKNQDDARQQANQNIYQSQQNQNFDGTKKEIQQLLNQLAQTNPTTDVVTEAIHQKIKTDPTFKARLLAALKAGGLEALKAIFNHPAFSIPAETIKGYLEAE